MTIERVRVRWTCPTSRRVEVKRLHFEGYKGTIIACMLEPDVNVKTVRRDMALMSLCKWSEIEVDDLQAHVLTILGICHSDMGIKKVKAYLRAPPRCLYVQDWRIKAVLVICVLSYFISRTTRASFT